MTPADPVVTALAGKKVALGVCGGIAAYKAAGLARELTLAGADVWVVMTASAVNFIGPITFSTLTGNPVRTELFPATAPTEIPHTDLGSTADLVMVAPATARIIAHAAQGLSGDLMSALLLAARCPVIMAPAMHTEMWCNAATQANVEKLIARGVQMVGPGVGALAGPDSGVGRLADLGELMAAAAQALARRTSMSGQRVIITAGGTREPIDAMRFIGNASSGKMGFALASQAVQRGASVTLITAPTQLIAPEAARVIHVTTAGQMRQAVMDEIGTAGVLIMAAAVADWRPVAQSPGKLSKSAGPPRLALEPTADILAEVGDLRRATGLPGLQVLVGFCAETGNLKAAAEHKLRTKFLDLAVANQVGTAASGAGTDDLRALILDREGRLEDFGLIPKQQLAARIMERVAVRLKGPRQPGA